VVTGAVRYGCNQLYLATTASRLMSVLSYCCDFRR
jgi:hypothetical protein